jgi:excinuclease UvrABC nuclease subunit
MVPITQLEDLPSCCGIYRVLNAAGTVIYVGQAQNIYQRWKKDHHKMSAILACCGNVAFIGSVLL